MKSLYVALFLVLVCPLLHGEFDPFASAQPRWLDAVLAERPYSLEVAFGEIDAPQTGDAPDASGLLGRVVDDAFLATAKRLMVGVGDEGSGVVEREGGSRMIYRIKKGDDGVFKLSVLLKDQNPGAKREINTDVSLLEGKWVVVGGLNRQEHVTDSVQGETWRTRTFLAAFRIQKRD